MIPVPDHSQEAFDRYGYHNDSPLPVLKLTLPGVDSIRQMVEHRQEQAFHTCRSCRLSFGQQAVLETVSPVNSRLAVRDLPDFDDAHPYCSGVGIEIGAAAHNPFHLDGCINVADNPQAYQLYIDAQVALCGSYAEVNLWCDAAEVNAYFDANSLDYVINSYVIEHHPNPLKLLDAWARMVNKDGIIFIIFPKRDALEADQGRDVTDFMDILGAYENSLTVQSAPEPAGQGIGGHYYVYTLGLMLACVGAVNDFIAKGYRLQVEEALETDDKVGNSHCVVLRQEGTESYSPSSVRQPQTRT